MDALNLILAIRATLAHHLLDLRPIHQDYAIETDFGQEFEQIWTFPVWSKI